MVSKLCSSDHNQMPKNLPGAPPLDAHLTVIKCLQSLSVLGLCPLTPAGDLHLDPMPIYAPLASLALLYLIVNTLPRCYASHTT